MNKETASQKLNEALELNKKLTDVIGALHDREIYPKTLEDIYRALDKILKEASDDYNATHKGKRGQV